MKIVVRGSRCTTPPSVDLIPSEKSKPHNSTMPRSLSPRLFPILRVLCTAVLSNSSTGSFWFPPVCLLCACFLSHQTSTKKPPLHPKTVLRGIITGICTLIFVHSTKRLGASSSLVLEALALAGLSFKTGKDLGVVLVGLGLVLMNVNSVSSALGLMATVCAVEVLHLFKDAITVGIAAVVTLVVGLGWRRDGEGMMTTGADLKLVMGVGLFALSSVLSLGTEKWFEYSENKRVRVVVGAALAAGWTVLVDKVFFAYPFLLGVALVEYGATVKQVVSSSTSRSLLPVSMKDEGGGLAEFDHDDVKSKAVRASRLKCPDFLQGAFSGLDAVIKDATRNNDSKKLFYFLCLTMSFMMVEVVVGLWTGSLGLISDAGHMFFDSAALFIGLFASYAARRRPDYAYTYGYGRYEIIAGFVNAVFLAFVAIFVLTESLERFSEPPEIRTEGLLLTSVVGLFVNGMGLMFFHEHAHSHGGGGGDHGHGPAPEKKQQAHARNHGHAHQEAAGACGHDHGHSHNESHADAESQSHAISHSNENMHGVYLHVLADALGSVGVITSSLMIQYKGWLIADPICSFCISVLIFLSVIPLLKSTASSLMLRTPPELEKRFELFVERCKRRNGVVQVTRAHLWRNSKDTVVGTITIVVSSKDMQEGTLSWASSAFKKDVGATDVTVQVCTDALYKQAYGAKT